MSECNQCAEVVEKKLTEAEIAAADWQRRAVSAEMRLEVAERERDLARANVVRLKEVCDAYHAVGVTLINQHATKESP